MHTIRDVARLADVSITTASAVINGKRSVRPALRLRVERAMQSLDYHPDSVARSLKVRRTMTVGVVVPDFTNPFYPEVIGPMEHVARKSGYSVIFCDSNEDRELEASQLSTLFSRRVDGVAIAPADPYGVRDRLIRQGIPFVFFDRVPANFPGAAVVTDNFEASRVATRYLIELGHERIGIVIHGSHLGAVADRLEGFRQALREAHLALPEEYIRQAEPGNSTVESAGRCALELLQLAPPPTAIFCGNNKLTLGAARTLNKLRIPCPERVSLLGFDDFEWAIGFGPQITTVAQPTVEMGKQAMELLVRQMEGGGDPPAEGGHVIVLPSELRIRESTAPPLGATPKVQSQEEDPEQLSA